ncbi:MAG: TonB-dependent receptor, partial [Bacteroidales bacterium]|nr:TonB-dependent receptor [Bacteroidales bacterium]
MQSSSPKPFLRALLPVAIAAIGGTALAQPSQEAPRFTALEEIIVTAQRRQESLQEVPIAVVALTADALEQRGVADTIALPEAVPSVKYTSSGPSGIFFIRGVGNSNAGLGEEGANAFYVDGVFMPDLFQSVLMFNNIDRVEVLKGPQGTLFGRNSSGGLIHVITREPEHETRASLKLGYANYDRATTQAYLGGGLTDTLSADIAITTANQGDGWGRNLTTGADAGKGWHWGLRSKLVWTPTDSARFTLAGDYMKLSSDTSNLWHLPPGATGMGFPPSPATVRAPLGGSGFNVASDHPTNTRIRVGGASLTAEFDLDWATLTSITAARQLTNDSGIDVDSGPLPLLGIVLDSETSSFQQEIRLASSETDPFGWQTGVFFLRSSAELTGTTTSGLLIQHHPQFSLLPFPVTGFADFVEQTIESVAVFGEGSYAFTPTTRVIAGLRYTRDEIDLDARQELMPLGIPAQAREDTASDR